MTLASQSSSSEVSGCGNKILTTILGSETAGGDHSSTTFQSAESNVDSSVPEGSVTKLFQPITDFHSSQQL